MYRIVGFAVLVSAFLLPSISFAAMLHLQPQATATSTGQGFSIAVLLDSDKPINTISVSLIFPKAVEPTNVRTSESVVSFWIDKPLWNETNRKLTFSGLVPGGLEGLNLPLVTVDCAIIDPKTTATVSFDQLNTHAYLSDGKGTETTPSFQNLVFPIAVGEESLSPNVSSSTPPEVFVPKVGRDPSIFEGKWFVAFSAQDKGTGIASYEVRERNPGLFWSIFPTAWHVAESPYLLSDQSLGSEIDVKAIDNAGNIRVESVAPGFFPPLYENGAFWIILICVSLLYVVTRFKRKG